MNPRIKFLIIFTHGLFLLIALWWLNNSSYSSSVDEGLIKKIFLAEDIFLSQKSQIPDNFFFIDVATDLQLINDPKSSGRIVITDRRKLADFFGMLADHHNVQQYVMADIYFDERSIDDKLLVAQVDRCKRVDFIYHSIDDVPQYPVISVSASLSTYETFSGKFTKFKLVYPRQEKTTPLVAYEVLSGKDYQQGLLQLDSFLPRYYIRKTQLDQHIYPYFKLGDLLALLQHNPALFDSFLKGKFIVIGNFSTDTHSTPIGKQPGSLIVTNCYLSLLKGRNQLSIPWVIFMLASLTYTSYVLLFTRIRPPKLSSKNWWIDFFRDQLFSKVFSFLALCSAIAFCSELFFSVQIVISPLFFYLTYISFAISFNDKRKNREKNEKTLS